MRSISLGFDETCSNDFTDICSGVLKVILDDLPKDISDSFSKGFEETVETFSEASEGVFGTWSNVFVDGCDDFEETCNWHNRALEL